MALLVGVYTGAMYFEQKPQAKQVINLGLFLIIAFSVLVFVTTIFGFATGIQERAAANRRGPRNEPPAISPLFLIIFVVLFIGIFAVALTRFIHILSDYRAVIQAAIGKNTQGSASLARVAVPAVAAPFENNEDQT